MSAMTNEYQTADDPAGEKTGACGKTIQLLLLGPGSRCTSATIRATVRPLPREPEGARGRVTVRGIAPRRRVLPAVATEIRRAIAEAVGLGPSKRARVLHPEPPCFLPDGELVLGSIAGMAVVVDVVQRGRLSLRAPSTRKALARTTSVAVTAALHRIPVSADICVLGRVPTVSGIGRACPDGQPLLTLLPVKTSAAPPVIVALPEVLSEEQIESPSLPEAAWFALDLDGEQALQLLRVLQSMQRVTRRQRIHRHVADATGLYAALKARPSEMVSWAVHPYGAESDAAPRNLFRALDEHAAAVVVGDLGSGKTTALTTYRDLCLGHVGRLDPEIRRGTAFPVVATAAGPVVVSLPSAMADDGTPGSAPTLEQAVVHELRQMGLSSRDARRLLRLGAVRLLLDSLNEVPGSRYQEVLAAIQHLRAAWPLCPLVVATRPHGFQPLDFSDFTALHLVPLDEHGQQRLLARSGIGLAEEVSEALAASATLQTLAGTPLYLRLLQQTFAAEGELPTDLGELMDKCIDAALRTLPKLRDPVALAAAHAIIARYAGLAVDRCLATQLPLELAREHLIQAQAQVASRQTVPAWIADLDAEGLLHLYLTCGLLAAKDFHVAFAHQSFRDSLAARLFVSETEDIPTAAFSRLADVAWDEACISLVLFAPPESLAGLLQAVAARDVQLALRALRRAGSERVTPRAEAAVVAALEALAVDPRLALAHRGAACAALGAAFVPAEASTGCPATEALERLCVDARSADSTQAALTALLRVAARPTLPAELFARAMEALAHSAEPRALLPLVRRRWEDLPKRAKILAAMPPEAGEMIGRRNSALTRRLARLILRDGSVLERLRTQLGWEWLPPETRAEALEAAWRGLDCGDDDAVGKAIEAFRQHALAELTPQMLRLALSSHRRETRAGAARAVRAVAAMPGIAAAGGRSARALKVAATQITVDSRRHGMRLLSILERPGCREESQAAAVALAAATELPAPVTTELLAHLRNTDPELAGAVMQRVLAALVGKQGAAAKALLKELSRHGRALGAGTEAPSSFSHELVWATTGRHPQAPPELVAEAYASAWRVMLAFYDYGDNAPLVWASIAPSLWERGSDACPDLLKRLLLAGDPFSLRTALLVGAAFTSVPAGVIPEALLNDWLQSHRPGDRYRAVVLAGKIGGPDALPAISDAISEAGPWYSELLTQACQAVVGIARRSPECAETAILLLLLHTRKLVAYAALPLAEALCGLARDRPDLCDTLFEILIDPDFRDQAARDKLAGLLAALGARAGAAPRFLKFLGDCPRAAAATQVARALGGCGDTQQAACLIAIAADHRVKDALRDDAYDAQCRICGRMRQRPTPEQLAEGERWWREVSAFRSPYGL